MPFSSSLFMEVPIPCGSMKRKTLCALRIFSIFPSLTLPCPSLFFFFLSFFFISYVTFCFCFFFFNIISHLTIQTHRTPFFTLKQNLFT